MHRVLLISSRYWVYYHGGAPCLWINDLDLVKQVTIKDFDHFTDFGFFDEKLLKIPGNDIGLANKSGEEWK